MRGICKRFAATVALMDVDFEVGPGEVHALVGENGAGKSTLMKILSGALPPDSGSMTLDGKPFAPRNPIEGRRRGVGMIYQELSIAPHLTVQENILLGVEPVRPFGVLDGKTAENRAREALTTLGHADMPVNAIAGDLSVNEQQVVEIARSLAMGCNVLVFDEPTSSLGQQDIARLFELIHRLRTEGIAIVYISHFLDEIDKVADRVTVLRDGSTVGTETIGDITTEEIIHGMVGRDVEDLYPRSKRTQGEPVLEVRDLAGMRKPASVSLTLHRGEVLGICGLVGAGRTEFLRTLFGLDRIRSGEITMFRFTGPATPLVRWDQGTGFLSEDRKREGLALNMSVADNLTLSRLRGFGPGPVVLPRHQHEAVNRWIDRFQIRCEHPSQPMHSLSGGNQQKAALARLLQHDVDIMLLDEPTRGVDVAAKAVIYELIDEMACGGKGWPAKAVLLVSSYLPELLGVCDRIAVMYRGTLLPPIPREEVDEELLMSAATGGESAW
jgi:ribose transport system ATP-binding protein